MKVSALRFSSSSLVREATSMRSSTQLRTDTASSMVFMPMALSASPGMGNVRVLEPPASTISSYVSSNSGPSSMPWTVTVRLAWSMLSTRPVINSQSARC